MTKVTIAGVSAKLPNVVLVVELDARRPIFHEPMLRGSRRPVCGAGLSSNRHPIEIPTRHARRFARPCLRCFPQLRTRQLELKAAPL